MNEPWSVQVEATFGCTRLCRFCGLRSVKNRPLEDVKFMTLETADMISKQLGEWFDHKRVEFALRGEPTLNPNITEIIKTFRVNFKKGQFMLSTNGDIIKKNPELVDMLFENGLNILMIDMYDRNYEFWHDFVKQFNYKAYNFYEDKVTPYRYYSHKTKMIILMPDIVEHNKESSVRVLNNQAGNAYAPDLGILPLSVPLRRRCHLPFREVSIYYNGNVPICCMDYKEKFIIGNIHEKNLKEIWDSEKFNAVRKVLYYGLREKIDPCKRCNYQGNKLGLVSEPDMSLSRAVTIIINNYTK